MEESINVSQTRLGDREKKSVQSFCQEVTKNLTHNLKSIVLYGSATRDEYQEGYNDINLLIIVDRINVPILKQILDPVTKGRRKGIAPFFLTQENLHSSADVFPVKFLSMRESYVLLWGEDLLQKLQISREHLRLRCEQEIKNLLLRLRRYYLYEGGRRLDVMLSGIFANFVETLHFILSLSNNQLSQREHIIESAAKSFDFDAEIVNKVKALHHLKLSPSRDEAEKLYDEFMSVVDKIAVAIDQMN